jgi:protein O-GlcNAc transferase
MSMNRRQRRADKTGKKAKPSVAGSQVQRVAPERAAGLFERAFLKHRAGALAEAVELYEQALSYKPDVPEALSNLGLALRDLGRADAAVARYEQALALKPNVPEVLSNLGLALKDLGNLDEAISRYRQALALRPSYPEALSNLGNALNEQKQTNEAIACFHQALRLRPQYPEALLNLGKALRNGGKLYRAAECYEQALALRPNFAEAHYNFATALTEQGRQDEAIAHYRHALALAPKDLVARSNLLFVLHYAERLADSSTLVEARLFADQVEAATPRPVFTNLPNPRRRLRVGYVSADFCTHPVGIFLEGILKAHNRDDVEIFCYSNSMISDDTTARLRGASDHWQTIVRLSDGEADAMIRRDGIDILVDLAGHTAGNRLPLFARKPAPVQVTWLGYVDTTGLPTMDYVLADRFVVPPDDEPSFTEAVRRLPDTYFCFTLPAYDVPITARPVDRPLTLGCFNNWAKITTGTIKLWTRILAEIPDSRLLLKTRHLDDPEMAREAIARFAAEGIGPERVVLEGPLPRADLLAAYNRIDIALDPFPYNGGLTTVEALWMGVPVVTLRGRRWVGRAAESILTTVGLSDLVADDGNDYARIVKALADDRHRLGALHSRLRAMVEGSALCDGPGLTRAVESLYRDMWKTWCASRVEEGSSRP